MAFAIDDIIIALVMMIVSFAISYALRPRPERNDAVVGNLEVPTASEGGSIPVVFGTMLLKDSNVIDYFDAKTEPIERGGGKK